MAESRRSTITVSSEKLYGKEGASAQKVDNSSTRLAKESPKQSRQNAPKSFSSNRDQIFFRECIKVATSENGKVKSKQLIVVVKGSSRNDPNGAVELYDRGKEKSLPKLKIRYGLTALTNSDSCSFEQFCRAKYCFIAKTEKPLVLQLDSQLYGAHLFHCKNADMYEQLVSLLRGFIVEETMVPSTTRTSSSRNDPTKSAVNSSPDEGYAHKLSSHDYIHQSGSSEQVTSQARPKKNRYVGLDNGSQDHGEAVKNGLTASQLNREETEALLAKNAVVGGCVVRKTSASTSGLTISVYHESQGKPAIRHYLVGRSKNGELTLPEFNITFNAWEELVSHFSVDLGPKRNYFGFSLVLIAPKSPSELKSPNAKPLLTATKSKPHLSSQSITSQPDSSLRSKAPSPTASVSREPSKPTYSSQPVQFSKQSSTSQLHVKEETPIYAEGSDDHRPVSGSKPVYSGESQPLVSSSDHWSQAHAKENQPLYATPDVEDIVASMNKEGADASFDSQEVQSDQISAIGNSVGVQYKDGSQEAPKVLPETTVEMNHTMQEPMQVTIDADIYGMAGLDANQDINPDLYGLPEMDANPLYATGEEVERALSPVSSQSKQKTSRPVYVNSEEAVEVAKQEEATESLRVQPRQTQSKEPSYGIPTDIDDFQAPTTRPKRPKRAAYGIMVDVAFVAANVAPNKESPVWNLPSSSTKAVPPIQADADVFTKETEHQVSSQILNVPVVLIGVTSGPADANAITQRDVAKLVMRIMSSGKRSTRVKPKLCDLLIANGVIQIRQPLQQSEVKRPVADIVYAAPCARNRMAIIFLNNYEEFKCYIIEVADEVHFDSIQDRLKTVFASTPAAEAARGSLAEARPMSFAVASKMMVERKRREASNKLFSFKRRSKGLADVDNRENLAEAIGLFKCVYIQGLPLIDFKTTDFNKVTSMQLNDIATAKGHDIQIIHAALSISPLGLKIIRMDNSEQLQDVFVTEIAHAMVLNQKRDLKPMRRLKIKDWDSELTVIITAKRFGVDSSPILGCEMLYLEKEHGSRLLPMIQDICTRANQRHGRLKEVFLAVGEEHDNALLEGTHMKSIVRSSLECLQVLGKGQYGEVFLASDLQGRRQVAVKIATGELSFKDASEFLGEAEIMAPLSHPAIVEIIGVAINAQPWLIVLEFCKYGDLRHLILTCAEPRFSCQLTYLEQLYCCCQVASALKYLGTKRLIHMDIAARNILVADKSRMKIADFGIARRIPNGEDSWAMKVGMKLPARWQAPESWIHKVFSVKTDCWSFGMMCWEVATHGHLPMEEVPLLEVEKFVCEGGRPAQPEQCTDSFFEIMKSCWAESPASRPDFGDICNKINGLASTLKKNGHTLRDIGMLITNPNEADSTKITWTHF